VMAWREVVRPKDTEERTDRTGRVDAVLLALDAVSVGLLALGVGLLLFL
jgi:hypothetical protein